MRIYKSLVAKALCSMFLVFFAFPLFAQTTILLNDGFENGKGSWIFSTVEGGNDYLVKPDKGYNSLNAVRSGAIGTTNFMISPAVNFVANKPYKLSFMAISARAQSRKIEVYYNSTASLNGSETLIGTIDEIPTTYTSFTLNLTNPAAGVKYIIFKGIVKANKYNEMCIDNVLLVQTQNYIPTVAITQPTEGMQKTAGKPLKLIVDASDADGTISLVKLFYKGELFESKTTTPYEFTIPNLPIGSNTFYAKAYDNSGDSAITLVRTVVGINTAPVSNLVLSQTAINQGDTVSFEATAEDSDGEIAFVSFFVNNERVATVKTSPYKFKWSNVRPGVYDVYAVATDNTGLNGSTDTLTITSTPTTNGVIMFEDFELGLTNWKLSTISGANDWKSSSGTGYNGTSCARRAVTNPNFMIYNTPYFFAKGNVTVEVQAKSKTSGKYCLQAGLIHGTDTIWSANSALVGTVFSNYSLTIDNQTSNYSNVIIRAVLGTTSGYVELWIDDVIVKGAGGGNNLPPVVKITAPVNAAELTLNSPVTINAEAYDLMGSVAKVEFYLGNEKIGEALNAPYSIQFTPTYPGVFSLKAVCTDNNGYTATSAISTFVNYPDRKVYDFVASSYLGEEAGSGKVWGSKILSDGVIVLSCDWGTKIPDGAVLHLLNGATLNSRGSIVRISADGKKILSISKVSNYVVDLSVDNNDNIYVAAAERGAIKLNRLADSVVYAKVFAKNVYRIDAGKTGYSAVLTRAGYDFDEKKWDKVSVYLLDPSGSIVSSFGGASSFTNDICIDESTQSVVVVGWRNISTNAKDNTNWLPVDIPGFKVFSFLGTLKYEGYNWSGDPASPDWLNRSENNMADTRIARVSMGDDGLMYFAAEVSGGNHILRYSPYDNMKKVRFVGGDNYHTLSNVGTEFHTFVGRLNLLDGNYIEGQSFTSRLSTGSGNTLDPEHGNIQADSDGRVYFTGTSAAGAPLSHDLIPEVAYSGGSFIYIMNPTLQIRELVDRVVLGKNAYDVGVRKFPNHDKTIVYGGAVAFSAIGKENQYKMYLKNPVQSVFYGEPTQQSGFYAVIGGTTPAQYELRVNGESKGMFTEGSKIALNAADYADLKGFLRWGNAGDYIADSVAVTTTFSMPGRNADVKVLIDNNTKLNTTYAANVRCYPNPAKDMVTIKLNIAQRAELKIFDALGKLMYSTIINGSKDLDVSGFKNGIYVVNIDNQVNKKLVIQH